MAPRGVHPNGQRAPLSLTLHRWSRRCHGKHTDRARHPEGSNRSRDPPRDPSGAQSHQSLLLGPLGCAATPGTKIMLDQCPLERPLRGSVPPILAARPSRVCHPRDQLGALPARVATPGPRPFYLTHSFRQGPPDLWIWTRNRVTGPPWTQGRRQMDYAFGPPERTLLEAS
jgi:hypothetical protein